MEKSAVHKTSLSNVLFEMNFKVRLLNDCVHYGSMGCGVFKRGGAKFERFFPKNQCTQCKLLNMGEFG